jgi:hypothetical protein
MGKRLDTTVNISILLTCALIAATLVPQFVRGSRSGSQNRAAPVIQTGDRIPAFATEGAAKRLVLAWKSQCQYCAESAGFYRELAKVVRDSQDRLSLVVMTTDAQQPSVEALQSLGISVSKVVTVTPQQQQEYKVLGTPTLIALSSSGLVEKVWMGKLNDDRQKEVFDFIAAVTGRSQSAKVEGL